MYQFIGPDYLNFATRKFDGITIGESEADVILNASLLEITHAQGVVGSVRVASMDDKSQKATEFTIQAGAFVLACGAVANAHQLLLSNVGNEYDQVGRYFMGHPIANYGYPIVTVTGNYLNDAEKSLMAGDKVVGSRGGNHWVGPSGETVQGRFSPNAEQQRKLEIGSCWFWANYSQYYFELASDAESRVTLAYFLPRLTQAPTDVAFALAYVKERADTPEKQALVLDTLRFKCDVLWAQLDALYFAYVEPGLTPPGAFVPSRTA